MPAPVFGFANTALFVVITDKGERLQVNYAIPTQAPFRWFDRGCADVARDIPLSQKLSGMVVIAPDGSVSQYSANEAVELLGRGVLR